MAKVKYKTWTLIDWDGNPELGYKCWRKSFGRGHVSVGVGDFKGVVYSYGPNSDDSLSGTRARSHKGKPDQTPQSAMAMVDRNNGKHNHRDDDDLPEPKQLEIPTDHFDSMWKDRLDR